MTTAGIQNGARGNPRGETVTHLAELLAPDRVGVPLRGTDKESVLSELVDLVVRSLGLAAQRDDIYRAVWEREQVLSTGIGDGIALPHAKYEGLGDLVMAAGVAREPVAYSALDGQPAQLFFLLLGSDGSSGAQVRALSRISRLLRSGSLRERLLAADDAGNFMQLLAEAEQAI